MARVILGFLKEKASRDGAFSSSSHLKRLFLTASSPGEVVTNSPFWPDEADEAATAAREGEVEGMSGD